ncbi:hypothetical protein [Nostoc foliaceum]|nr:hypothetical protein [Nostoc foliaceum]
MYKMEIKTLELFNYKAYELGQSSFNTFLLNSEPKITIGSGRLNQENFPSKDSINACVLTIRLFMQDNERISLRKVKRIYEDLPINTEKKARFDNLRNKFNDFLDRKSLCQRNIIIIIGEAATNTPTNRDILEAFIYGEYAHFTQREKYEMLTKQPFDELFTGMEFIMILRKMIQTILDVSDVNQEVISDFKKTVTLTQ